MSDIPRCIHDSDLGAQCACPLPLEGACCSARQTNYNLWVWSQTRLVSMHAFIHSFILSSEPSAHPLPLVETTHLISIIHLPNDVR